MNDLTQIEGPMKMGMNDVGPMELIHDKVHIIWIPPFTHMDGMEGSTTLDETLRLKIV